MWVKRGKKHRGRAGGGEKSRGGGESVLGGGVTKAKPEFENKIYHRRKTTGLEKSQWVRRERRGGGENEKENEVESGLWLAEGPSPAFTPPPLLHSVSSPNTTESPTSPATSGTAGYIIAAIIVSQVITAREHPPRLQLRQQGEGQGRGCKSWNELRRRERERESGGSGGVEREGDSQR